MSSYKILVLSDLHLGEEATDSRYPTFLEVLEKFQKSSYDELFLMGDIFDILIGAKKFWRRIHPQFFTQLECIVKSGKKVTWVQGNHDFQLGGLLRPMGVQWIEESQLVSRMGQKIFLAHGDLADPSDKLHPLWRAFLSSTFMAIFIKLLPEYLAEKFVYPLTLKLSQGSRKRSYQASKTESAKQVFRKYAKRISLQHEPSLILLGHSHISDDHQVSDRSRYLNFGSWYEDPQVGVLTLSQESVRANLCSASSWLQEPEQ